MAGKNVKRYKCPYCEKRVERNQLQYHIGKAHQDMIPQGYTAARVAFNYLNKKTEGHCIICGGVTDWNEDKKRYERLCNKPACKKKYVKMTEDRLKKARGVTKKEMMSDPHHQDMMLKNRSISGIYKFEDGGKVPYVGSYEKNFLEFMDQYLHVSSMDIQAPGPTIEYYFEGKKHFWITDFYYTPYNLVFDIKDGGSNPNKRQMDEYRAKQRNKEAAIIEQGEYNYLRLTDNKFDQLIEIMMDLKDSMAVLDGPYYQKVSGYKPVVKINESLREPFYAQGKYTLLVEAKSTLDRNFKKKEIDAEFKYINISNMGKYKPQVEKHYGKFFDYTVKHSTGEIVVDVKKDKVAGYVFVNNTDQKGFIMPLVVVKEYRGCGLGSKLFEDAITKYGGTDLCVDKDNEIAIKLYKDHGFEIVGDGDTKNRYYMIKHGVKITNEVFCQSDPEMVTYKVLTDPTTYKNRDITKLVEYVQSLSESTREYNKSFFDTALAQTEAFYHEYSNFIKSGKCSYDVQSICESFSLKEVTLSEIQAIYTELKTLFSECTTPIVEEQLNSFDLDYLKEYVL